jgi:hypothetical protein
LVPHTEVTLGNSGRADTLYNRFIVEWEKPGSLKPSNTADPTSSWVTGSPLVLKALVKHRGESVYREQAHQGVNTGGAYAVYWFEVLKDHGDGTVTARNITKGAKRKIESVQVRLEKGLLFPLVRGRDLTRLRVRPSAHLFFVQDPKTRHGVDQDLMKQKYPHAFAWLERNRTVLESRSAYKRYFKGEDPFNTIRVVRRGGYVDQDGIPDQKKPVSRAQVASPREEGEAGPDWIRERQAVLARQSRNQSNEPKICTRPEMTRKSR